MIIQVHRIRRVGHPGTVPSVRDVRPAHPLQVHGAGGPQEVVISQPPSLRQCWRTSQRGGHLQLGGRYTSGYQGRIWTDGNYFAHWNFQEDEQVGETRLNGQGCSWI